MAQLIDHIFCEPPRHNRSGTVHYSGDVLTTTVGTLGVGAANVDTPFFTLSKTAAKTGRYKVQLIDSRGQPVVGRKLCEWSFGLTLAADTAYPIANGLPAGIRNDLISTLGTFEIQFARSDTEADAEVLDGAKIWISFDVKKSSATP